MRTLPINEVRQKRKEILLIITTVVILTSAINFLTSYLSTIFLNKPIFILLFGIIILFIGLIALIAIFLKPTERIVRIQGAIAYEINDETIKPVEILSYSFNDKFCEYLHSFICENKAYAKILIKRNSNISVVHEFNPDILDHFSIINSVIEFTLLHMLELHLNSYFVKNEIDENKIVSLRRNQLSPDILKNRVIDMITKDMNEREAFLPHPHDDGVGEIVYCVGENGIIFNRIKLELPPKSKLFRNDKGFIVVSNRLFDLTIMPQYIGTSTYVSPIFMNGFFSPDSVTIKLHVRTKNNLFFNNQSIETYEWLDSFIDELENEISIEKLEQRLNPEVLEFIRDSLKNTNDNL